MTKQATTFLLTVLLLMLSMLAAYILSRLLTGWARRWGLKHGIVSHVTHRSSHSVPTPRVGGVGLALGFALAGGLFLGGLWLTPHSGAALGFNPAVVGWVGLGWLIMLVVGLLDDLFDLPPLVKLGLEFVAALAPTLGGRLIFDAADAASLPTAGLLALNVAVSVLWILFFTNGFNFMDGMDGFAANFARFSAGFMFAVVLVAGFRYGSLNQLRGEAFLLPILAMACWGFLHWNRPPASVFMGDGGSLSLGYLLALGVILGYRGHLGLRLAPITSFTILLPFIFDVLLTLVRRARRGENLLKAHREHLYQRLMRGGLSHARVLAMNLRRFTLCGLAALAGAWSESATGRWLFFAAALGVMIEYWLKTLKSEKLQQ